MTQQPTRKRAKCYRYRWTCIGGCAQIVLGVLCAVTFQSDRSLLPRCFVIHYFLMDWLATVPRVDVPYWIALLLGVVHYVLFGLLVDAVRYCVARRRRTRGLTFSLRELQLAVLCVGIGGACIAAHQWKSAFYTTLAVAGETVLAYHVVPPCGVSAQEWRAALRETTEAWKTACVPPTVRPQQLRGMLNQFEEDVRNTDCDRGQAMHRLLNELDMIHGEVGTIERHYLCGHIRRARGYLEQGRTPGHREDLRANKGGRGQTGGANKGFRTH